MKVVLVISSSAEEYLGLPEINPVHPICVWPADKPLPKGYVTVDLAVVTSEEGK
jgi:hypothetical protein